MENLPNTPDITNFKIAYLGMGIMGSAMAANLAKAGCQVAVWNRTSGRPGTNIAKEAGATVYNTIEEAVRGRKFIITCVSDIPDINELLLGPNGVATHAEAGSLVIDTSTIGPK